MSKKLKAHYKALLTKYGDSAESAQYSSRETQERRFAVLVQIANLDGRSILDFGCGTGHFATYLEARGIRVRYTGVDIVEDFLPIARTKHPSARFTSPESVLNESFDYVFVSGVFNNKRRDNRSFYQETLKKLFGLCSRGMAFNMMSTYVDYRDAGLFYESPVRAFQYVKKELTPFVTLRHDYEVKTGIIPFEFAIYAFKNSSC